MTAGSKYAHTWFQLRSRQVLAAVGAATAQLHDWERSAHEVAAQSIPTSMRQALAEARQRR
jgi:hypothetical protein